MDLDRLFDLANLVALAGWIALLATPFAPRVANILAAIAVPFVLSIAYVGLIAWLLAGTPSAGEGAPALDFASLEGVAALFATREAVLVGWVHYLAFDLVVGAWEARTARAEGIAFLLVLPCLALTLFFGPAGFAVFLLVRAAARRRPS